MLNKENSFDKQCYLVISLKNLSSLKSMFAKENPNYFEGRYINENEVNENELKNGFGRVRRIIANINLQINDINDIFQFKFPRLSYICLIVKIIILL